MIKRAVIATQLVSYREATLDKPGNQIECSFTVRLVQGEHRIGIFASESWLPSTNPGLRQLTHTSPSHSAKFIAAGSEILLNYGPEFFKDGTASGEPQGATSAAGPTTHATPGRNGQSVGAIDTLVEEGNTSDMSYQPSLAHSRSGSSSP